MKYSEISIEENRWYRVNFRTHTEDLPSVNTILKVTESPENKKRLAAWKFKQSKKFLAQNRTCQNCAHFQSSVTSQTLRLSNQVCLVGEKLRSPIDKKHRCKSFAPNAEIKAAKIAHGEKSRERGSEVHRHIQNWFDSGVLPTPEHCQYASKISHLLKNLDGGKILVEEFVLSEKYSYGGRVDFCGEYAGQIPVTDWVTTDRNFLQAENFEHKFLQCAGYAIAIEEMNITKPTEIMVVAMSPTEAKLFREPLDKWTELWLKKVEQFWLMQPSEEIPF